MEAQIDKQLDKKWLELLSEKNQMELIMKENDYSVRYGLSLSEADAKVLLVERRNVLREQRRVEFKDSILPKIIHEFCDSAFIEQESYADTLLRLQDIFFQFKNEMLDEITDDELLHFMKEQFDTVCYGDLDYLAGTCLTAFASAIRAGYRGYERSEGYGEYVRFDAVPRWDREVFLATLSELIN